MCLKSAQVGLFLAGIPHSLCGCLADTAAVPIANANVCGALGYRNILPLP